MQLTFLYSNSITIITQATNRPFHSDPTRRQIEYSSILQLTVSFPGSDHASACLTNLVQVEANAAVKKRQEPEEIQLLRDPVHLGVEQRNGSVAKKQRTRWKALVAKTN